MAGAELKNGLMGFLFFFFYFFIFSLATDRLVDNTCVTTAEETEGLWLRSFARTVYK